MNIPFKKDTPPATSVIKESPSMNFNISNVNTQSQSQEVNFNLFIEIIKEELTEEQFREILSIKKEYSDRPQEAKTKMLDKIKSFGSNVAANIVAGIATNPSLWGLL